MWFTAGAKKSAPFTFTSEVAKSGDVLVMAAEDYTRQHATCSARARAPARST